MYDVIIIGAGPGGYVCAIRAAQFGLKTAIVEKDALGGVCLNWGCIPSKALLHSAHMYDLMKHGSDFGITASSVKYDFDAIIKRSRDVPSKLRQGIEFLLKKNKVDIIKGTAEFNDLHTIKVDGKSYEAKHIVIATGSRAKMLPGLAPSKRVWTAKEAMMPPFKPEKLLVIGSGAIGMEFASFYNDLDTKVTVIELLDRILPQEDEEISKLALSIFKKKGIEFLLGTRSEKIEEKGDGIVVTLAGNKTLTFDAVLIAIGVTPNIEPFKELGIDIENGFIKTDGHHRTNHGHIFAIGDIASPPWLAHKASHEGIRTADIISGAKHKPLNAAHIPSCTYCSPQIASIGLSEAKAKEHGFDVVVGRFQNSANGKSLAIGEEEGLIKTIFDRKTGAFLGAHMIGPDVTEMIQACALALRLEATEEDFMETIFPHPTLSEMIHESALDAFGRAIHKA